jgi:hypothetical protein
MSKYFFLIGILIIAGSCRTSENNKTLIQDPSFNNENYIEHDRLAINLPKNYSLNKIQGKDGAIYYIESQIDATAERHGEIFLGFHPGTVELFYDHDSKIETVSVEILDQKRDLGIYREKNAYATIAILPIKDNGGFETYTRIIGIENTMDKLYELINSFSTLTIQ